MALCLGAEPRSPYFNISSWFLPSRPWFWGSGSQETSVEVLGLCSKYRSALPPKWHMTQTLGGSV